MSTTDERVDVALVGQVFGARAPEASSALIRPATPEEIAEDEAKLI